MSFGNESGGHWYKAPSGEPFYSIGDRGVTLRDARKIGAVPSVTTVLQVIDKPTLTNWLIEQAVLGALTLPKIDGEADSAWIARIKVDGRAGAKAAAEEGTRIHDAIEQCVCGGLAWTSPKYHPYIPHVEATIAELKRLFPDVRDWVSEKSFAHPLGFGGKVDLHSPSTGIVVDYKTKASDFSDGKRLDYDQNVQLAAYQVGLGVRPFKMFDMDPPQFSPTQCANIFVSRTHPGCVASHVWSADDIAYGWDVF
ncbi:MAG TPA: hypothetical protein VHQ21_17095, partial [Rhodanobacteraceae bacterium]|nr:hypothetical protein [Rhodanobacteraceae bacterium]